jgi:hypothetical protein
MTTEIWTANGPMPDDVLLAQRLRLSVSALQEAMADCQAAGLLVALEWSVPLPGDLSPPPTVTVRVSRPL